MVSSSTGGTITEGNGLLTATLLVITPLGPADLFDLSFDLTGVDGFILTYFDSMTDPLMSLVWISASILHCQSLHLLHGIGHNTSGYGLQWQT